jgi:acyl carrier protein
MSARKKLTHALTVLCVTAVPVIGATATATAAPAVHQPANPAGPQTTGNVTQEKILEGLAEIVSQITAIPAEDVKLDKSFTADLNIDSLDLVEVVVAAEDRFDVKIPDGGFQNLKTVGDAVNYILANARHS